MPTAGSSSLVFAFCTRLLEWQCKSDFAIRGTRPRAGHRYTFHIRGESTAKVHYIALRPAATHGTKPSSNTTMHQSRAQLKRIARRGPCAIRTNRRMAYIRTILRDAPDHPIIFHSNTYACDEAILNMGVQYYADTPKVP